MVEPISFSQKLEEIRKKKIAEGREVINFAPPAPAPMPEFKKEDVPDVLGDRTDDDIEMDKIIESINIVDAYAKWCGKSQPKVGNRTEGIKVSCPKPNHPDRDPSAWLNTDKGTWYCGGCEEGGDAHDIAAYHFGYPVPGYKDGATFHQLRKKMAESFGWYVKKVPGGEIIYKDDTPEPDPRPPSQQEPQVSIPTDSAQQPADSNVAQMYASEDDMAETVVIYPTIEWRSLVTPDTFLYKYMEACTNDDSPEEYHFWHGLLALGHAVGRKVTLDDHRPVYANLLVCLLGGTGTGKTRSKGWLDEVIKSVMPYKETGLNTQGVKLVPVPSSGEYLVSAFTYEGKDPTDPKRYIGPQPVNGIVDFDELSSLLSRANRQGSTMKPTIMGFADARDEVKIGGLQRGDFVAVQPFCSITASTQPKAVRSILSKTDTGSGFLNRWVFAGGPAKEREVIGGSHSSTVVDLDAAVTELKSVYAYGGFKRSITLEDDALVSLTAFYKNKVFPMQQQDDTDLLKRLDLLFKKIILLFTINEKRDTVTVDIVRKAIKMFDYVVECYAILNENIGVTTASEIVNAILDTVKKHYDKTKRGASIRDMQRYLARRNYSPDQLKKALETMIALDMIELVKSPKGQVGRPTARYIAVGE